MIVYLTLTLLGLSLTLLACSTKSDSGEDFTLEESEYDGATFIVDCNAIKAHFVTESTPSVDDWTGYWQCFQEYYGCEGTGCSWNIDELDDYVVSERCADAGSCTIEGQTVQECETVSNTGSVTFDCSVEGEMTIIANGLPDHTFENYAQSGELPPLLGSTASNTEYTFPTAPIYNGDSDLFMVGGGTIAVGVNGVSIFNQFTGIGTVAVEDEIVDDCGGHPANGTYHYHAFPICGELATPERIGTEGSHSGLVGVSLDGFPIFGPFGYSEASDNGSTVTLMESCYAQTACNDSSDSSCYVFDDTAYANGNCHLDKCNGRVTAVPESLQTALGNEIYAYYMTVDSDGVPAFPYQPYCYRGDAGNSGSSGPQDGPPSGPPN